MVVKLPGSFTQDTTTKGLIDEEVYAPGARLDQQGAG